MPKVTVEYLVEKRNYILECTAEILKEKPLYLITMRDIIKKAGFSQGTIYRYYANLDEIFVDLINRNTIEDLAELNIDALLGSDRSEREIIFDCFIAMGRYIESLMQSAGGNLYFEIIVTYAYDAEKKNNILSQLKFKQNLEAVQQKIIGYAINCIDKGMFKPEVSVETIVQFASVFIDGIAQNLATNIGDEHSINIYEMFETLAKAVLGFLGEARAV